IPKKRCDFGWGCSILAIEGSDSRRVELYNVFIKRYLVFYAPIGLSSRQNFTLGTSYRSLWYSVDCQRVLTSGRRHSAKILPGSKEVFEPIVVTHDPINNSPTATHDLRRQHYNEVQEPTELHPK